MSEYCIWKRRAPVALLALAMVSFGPVGALAQDTPTPEVSPRATQPTGDAGQTAASDVTPDAPDQAAAPASVALVAGLVSASVAADQQITGTTGEGVTRTMLAHPDLPGTVHTALIAGLPGTDPASVTAAITDRLATIDSVAQGDQAGVPVWVVSGAARHAPDGGRPGHGQPRAHLMVTQACLPGGGPVLAGVVTTPTRSAPPVLAAILSTLAVTLPDDAAPCPPDLGAAIMALPLGALDHPEEPAAPEPAVTEPQIVNGPPPVTFLNGVVQIAVASDQIVDDQQERGRAARLALSHAGAPGQTQVFFAMEARETAQPDLVDDVARRLIQITSVSAQVIGGVPVWVMDGGADRNPDLSRADAGQTRPARIVVTRDCLPDAGPVVVGALATQAHLDRVGGFDAVTATLALALPRGSSPCPDTLGQALAAIPLTGAAPQPAQTPPASTGDPEILAWETARATGTAPALWTFLKAYPQSAFAAQARAALQALTQPPRTAPPAAPPPAAGKRG